MLQNQATASDFVLGAIKEGSRDNATAVVIEVGKSVKSEVLSAQF